MRPIGVIGIVSVTAGWLMSAGAEDAPPANRSGDALQQPPRIRLASPASQQPAIADMRPTGEAARRAAPADNAWQWSFQSQRPVLEYRLSEGSSVRVHGSRNGTTVYLNWRF